MTYEKRAVRRLQQCNKHWSYQMQFEGQKFTLRLPQSGIKDAHLRLALVLAATLRFKGDGLPEHHPRSLAPLKWDELRAAAGVSDDDALKWLYETRGW